MNMLSDPQVSMNTCMYILMPFIFPWCNNFRQRSNNWKQIICMHFLYYNLWFYSLYIFCWIKTTQKQDQIEQDKLRRHLFLKRVLIYVKIKRRLSITPERWTFSHRPPAWLWWPMPVVSVQPFAVHKEEVIDLFPGSPCHFSLQEASE